MTSPVHESTRTVVVSEGLVRTRAAELIAKGGDSRVLVMRAQPRWTGGELTVGGHRVRVVEGISQLAILDAYANQEPDEYLVVLTDRPRSDLNETVLTRAYRQQIENPDEWGSIPALFGAKDVSRELRSLEWAATALLDHEPNGGWAPSSEFAVTAEHAIGGLLALLLGIDHDGLDAVVIMTALSDGARSSWSAVDPALQLHLIGWAERTYGTAASFALRTTAAPGGLVKPLALGLAIDVLWPHPPDDLTEEQVAARTRLTERYAAGHSITPLQAREIADASMSAVLRMSRAGDQDGRLGVVLDQAEALLRDNLGWPTGAERSTILRPGFTAGLRTLGAALDAGTGVEEALAAVLEHREAGLNGQDVAPRMAVRLSRWLATKETASQGLGEDLQRQIDDGAWVDVALGVVWSGSPDPEVAAAYGRLIERVRARRRARDENAAMHLNDAPVVSTGSLGREGGVLGVENLLRGVVGPWKTHGGVLLVVLDGMNSAIGVELASDVARAGLVEWVPGATKRRLTAVAALPSETGISRTSLFCGEIREGSSGTEQTGLATVFPGGRVFHKAELRAPGGSQLAADVATAIADPKVPVVGVVINAIDDATHKNDTAGRPWALADLDPLRALLNAAALAGRCIVLTSDHGHIVERGTQMLPSSGGDSRWRPVGSGPVTTGEVLVRGPRVGLPSGEAILLWRDDARYGPARSGYHGGASLAELTIPVLVFQRSLAQKAPTGWEAAPPQVPAWWNDPVIVAADKPQPAVKKSRTKPKVDTSVPSLFEIDTDLSAPAEAIPASSDLVTKVLSSPVYADQLRLAGRAAGPAQSLLEAILRTLVERGGRAHQDTVASAAGLPSTEMGQNLAVAKRVLNVEGYDILGFDSDGETLRLDVDLLRDQFGVS